MEGQATVAAEVLLRHPGKQAKAGAHGSKQLGYMWGRRACQKGSHWGEMR